MRATIRIHLLRVKIPIVSLVLFSFFTLLTLQPLSAQETELLWGDTHVHTSNSVDAYSYGNFMADPGVAFRFAKGLPVLHPATAQRVRIDRPLDFLVVADHSEMLQLQYRLSQRDPNWMSKPTAQELVELMEGNPKDVFTEVTKIVSGGRQDILKDFHQPDLVDISWAEQVSFADANNEPGKFTALIGWEWSPGPGGANLHRVVFTSSNAEVARQFTPLSYYDTEQPEGLWDWLETTSERTGADFVAIPHNSNLSDGKMFDMVDSEGRSLTSEYARTRMRWEPVIEITQTKGTSETAPILSPDDSFADFEIRNVLLSGAITPINKGSYARPALKRGLQIESETGLNPFKFGVIGSTDSHTGLVSVDESNHYGKLAADSSPIERLTPSAGGFDPWRTSASGLTGVWASANTREAITRAFKRKEVYATTGSRIAVRFFGGFNFEAVDSDAKDVVAVGYNKGVAMGSDLTAAPAGKSPSFLIQVTKDPAGANLDRVQIVKGWMDERGETFEKVFNVVWSDDRQLNEAGLLPRLPSTVLADSASYTNSVGSVQLTTVWQDPEFEANQSAFYYVRALEIKTPRLQVFDLVALGLPPNESQYPVVLQERAYSSPIWFTP